METANKSIKTSSKWQKHERKITKQKVEPGNRNVRNNKNMYVKKWRVCGQNAHDIKAKKPGK